MPVAGAALSPESSSGTGLLSMPNPMLNDLSIPAPLPGLTNITK